MAEKGSKPLNRRFEAMRSQIKNTLFEATIENSSPKSLKQDPSSQQNSMVQTMRKLPQKMEPPTLASNPTFEQGKWFKMSDITQKRNFEMMRMNLKVQMFGRTENDVAASTEKITASTSENLESEANNVKPDTEKLEIEQVDTADSFNDTLFNPQDDKQKASGESTVLHSLFKYEKDAISEEKKEPTDQQTSQQQQESKLRDFTPRTNSIFKKFEVSQEQELGEKSPEDVHIFFIQNTFNEFYDEMETLGEGTSGIVKRCVRIANQEEFAVKIVNFKGDDEIKTLIIREFRNHRRLKHKNIVSVHELYIDNFRNKIYTVMELVRCREMFDVIQELGSFCEADASIIFKQILLAIQYMHSTGVCHRDLKPNNILASNDGKIVKITDFNVSKFVDKAKKQYTGLSKENYKMWTYTGTIAFTAPEVLADTEYTEIIDAWSAGCVLYTMLCGHQPFQAEFLKDLIDKIIVAKVEYNPEHWSKISPEAIDLVQKLLEKDPKKRFSPSQALSHSWICNVGKVPTTQMTGLTKNLRSNARRNSKAAFLKTKTVEIASLLASNLPRKNTPEKLYEPRKCCDGDGEDEEFEDISFNKFASERPRNRLPEP